MSDDSKRCRVRIYAGTVIGHPCWKPGKAERNGVWYCTIHDPEKVAARRAASEAKWNAKHEAEKAARNQTRLAREALERDAACWRRLEIIACSLGHVVEEAVAQAKAEAESEQEQKP